MRVAFPKNYLFELNDCVQIRMYEVVDIEMDEQYRVDTRNFYCEI